MRKIHILLFLIPFFLFLVEIQGVRKKYIKKTKKKSKTGSKKKRKGSNLGVFKKTDGDVGATVPVVNFQIPSIPSTLVNISRDPDTNSIELIEPSFSPELAILEESTGVRDSFDKSLGNSVPKLLHMNNQIYLNDILNQLQRNLNLFKDSILKEESPNKINKDIADLKANGFDVEDVMVPWGTVKHIFKIINGKKINCGPLLFSGIFRTVLDIEDFIKIKLKNKNFKEYFLKNTSDFEFQLRFDDTSLFKDQWFNKDQSFNNDYVFIQLANNYGLQGDGGAQEGAARSNNPYVREAWRIILKNHNNFNFLGAFHLMGAAMGYDIGDTNKIKGWMVDEEIAKYIFTENREISFENGTSATFFGTTAMWVPDGMQTVYKNSAFYVLKANYYALILQALIKSFQIRKPIKLLFSSIGTGLYNNERGWYESAFLEAIFDAYILIKNSIGVDFQMPLKCERVIFKQGVPDQDKNNMALASKDNRAEYDRMSAYLKSKLILKK